MRRFYIYDSSVAKHFRSVSNDYRSMRDSAAEWRSTRRADLDTRQALNAIHAPHQHQHALTAQSTAVDYVGYTSNQENTRARSLLAITLAIVID